MDLGPAEAGFRNPLRYRPIQRFGFASLQIPWLAYAPRRALA